MLNRLEKCVGLKATQLAHIGQLEQLCNQFENLQMKLNWEMLQRRPADQINDFLFYADDIPVGYLALYGFNNSESEVTAMTHPAYRRQGIFGRLLAAAQQELAKRGTLDFLFICERASVSGVGVMQAIKAGYDFSEFKMSLKHPPTAIIRPEVQLRPAGQADLPVMVQLDRLCFDVSGNASQTYFKDILTDPNRRAWIVSLDEKTIGKIVTLTDGTEAYISGFCLLPEYQNKGYGTVILTNTVTQLATQGYSDITLEVATDNNGALSLYKRCGFEVFTVFDYYRLPVQPTQQQGI